MEKKRRQNVITVLWGILLYRGKTRFLAISSPIIIGQRVSGQEQTDGFSPIFENINKKYNTCKGRIIFVNISANEN